MDNKIIARVKQLEKRHGVSDVIGYRETGSKLVKIFDTDEEIPYDNFFEKYPDATLIHVEYKDSPADIIVTWSDDD